MKVRNILKEMVPKVICRFVKHVTLNCIQSLGWIIINRMSWVFTGLLKETCLVVEKFE